MYIKYRCFLSNHKHCLEISFTNVIVVGITVLYVEYKKYQRALFYINDL